MISAPAAAAQIQRRLFRLTTHARVPLVLTAAAATGGSLAAIASMIVAGRLIASAQSGGFETREALRLLLALILLRAAFVALMELTAQRLATAVKSHLRILLVDRLVSSGPYGRPGAHTGELATIAVEGIEKLDAFYRRFVPQALATAIAPLLVLLAVAWFDPVSAVILALTAPLIPLFMWLLGTMAERKARAQWHALSRLGGRFLDTLQGLPTLKMFGRAGRAAAEISEASEELRARTMGVLRVAFLSGFVLELAASVSTAIVAAGIGVRLLEGLMPFGAGLTVLLLTPEFYLPFRLLGQRHHAGMEGVAAAEQIFSLLDASPAPRESRSVTAHPRTPLPSSCTIRLEGVTVRYPGSDGAVIENVSLTIQPRTLTAIVGPSGAGKSTLLRTLLRLVEPAEGLMTMDGSDARRIPAEVWRGSIAYVPQRPRFIQGSVLDNLRVADPHATLAEAIAAARSAGADAFIDALPHSYLTRIDENGSRLSGGERQRLALARALLKPAPVLLLDEPTASVDEVSEALIARALARVSRERAVVIVAHRHNSIKHADTIVLLQDGRIIGLGSHEEVYAPGRV